VPNSLCQSVVNGSVSVNELEHRHVMARGQKTGDAWRPSAAIPSTSRAQAQVEHRAATSTPSRALILFSLPLALAGLTEAETGATIAAATVSELARAHHRTTSHQIASIPPLHRPAPPRPASRIN
jgi:hypothetical protein